MFQALDSLAKTIHFHDDLDFVQNAWLYGRIGQVIIVLGILMFIEKYFNIKESLFLKVGQNTLSIYIIHVIILYGGVIGFGLKDFIADKFKSITSNFWCYFIYLKFSHFYKIFRSN